MESEVQLPGWLKEILTSDHAHKPRDSITRPEQPEVGDLFLIVPGKLGAGTNRVAGVIEVDSSMKVVKVALLTNETEYACDWDVHLTAEELALPYKLMLECDIVSSVWWSQLGQHIGKIPVALRQGVAAATKGDFSAIDESRRGTPIHGPGDPRWVFREHELSAMHALSHECMSRLIDGLTLDPGVVASIAEVEPAQQREIAAALCDRATIETVAINTGSLELLYSSPDSIDPDVWNALKPLIEAASGAGLLTHSDSLHVGGIAESAYLRRSPAVREAFDSLLSSLFQQGVSIAHVLTRQEVWGTTDQIFQVQSDQGPQFTLVPEMLR